MSASTYQLAAVGVIQVPFPGMITLPNMLMIGSTGRNVGKTEFACSLLRRFGAAHGVIGLKVTTIREKDGTCPRGGKGCGVCSSLTGEYGITEENDPGSGKDTSRLLAAGAARVLWLRVMRDHLEEGMAALLAETGRDRPLICESNSLRAAVWPGLFLMARDPDETACKASAAAVRKYVDRMLLSDGKRFDIDLETINWDGARWTLREDASAIVLAGGDSRRMRQDKSMLPVCGRPMIQYVCEQLRGQFPRILISANDPAKYAFLGLPVVPDGAPGQGPLMGIASALHASGHELNLVLGCDMPDLDIPFARQMLAEAAGFDAVVPRTGNDLLEPLFAVYRKELAGKMTELLHAGIRKVRAVFEHCRVKYLDAPNPDRLANLNTEADYQTYVARDRQPSTPPPARQSRAGGSASPDECRGVRWT
ncbi:MAG: NTP transferase domain-containing protein [Kiritimatiellae bacterium]|nr:NTP transferase domain-containing protein [Kiritimatiellia bacterium]